MSKQTQSFNAEIKQLLDIVVHSLYSQKEIFLRELISNSSDALDKLRFESLTNPELLKDSAVLEIRLKPDSVKNTLQIVDNGIGMSPDEVTQYIGTIAKSGTKAFVKMNLETKSKPDLIGQFGVGFYSSFMVAAKVTLHTQKAGSAEGTIWESTGDGNYTIESASRPEGHGTTITLQLKSYDDVVHDDQTVEKAQNFTDEWTLKSLVKKYSDFISWPIKMSVESKKEKEVVIEDQILNSQKALWLRSPPEIKEDEYKEFYHHLTSDWQPPAKQIHFKAEGTTEFTALLYVPSKKPFNYQMKEYEFGLSLYIKRIFIMENCKEVLPPYLRFVKGLVDSSDLSLNVSRELLQQDRMVTLIRKNIINKILGSLKDWVSKDRKSYEEFWLEFGTTLKEGIPTDNSQTEKIQDLLLFRSSHSPEFTTLEEYVGRMKPEQKDIYYIAGERLETLEHSPYMEKLKEKNYEVLFLTDAVDEWLTQSLRKYKEKPLSSVTTANLNFDTEEEKKKKEIVRKAQAERFGPLIQKIKENLADKVKDVVISDRLKETPVCLVTGENDISANMQKILSKMGENVGLDSKRILEINADHVIFETMAGASDEQIKNWSEILFNQALLTEGNSLPNPVHYSKLISDLMIQSATRR